MVPSSADTSDQLAAPEPGDGDLSDRSGAQVSPELAASVVDAAVHRHFALCHARVAAFVDRNFALAGALRLHGRAFGWDIIRVPINVVLILPKIATLISAAGLRTLGAHELADRVSQIQLFLETDVGRELLWRLHVELLELPVQIGDRRFEQDGIAREILNDPRLTQILADVLEAGEERLGHAETKARLEHALAEYTGARTAAAELTNALFMLATGAGVMQQLTPGAISMGPAVAAVLAQQAAVASFPLGAGLGGAWYSIFPAQPSAALVAGSTLGVVVLAAVAATFAGVVTDPVLRRVGFHERRLHRLLDTLEQNLTANDKARFAVRDHYLTRVMDLVDVVTAALR